MTKDFQLGLSRDLYGRTIGATKRCTKIAAETGRRVTVEDIVRDVEAHLPLAYPAPMPEGREAVIARMARDILSRRPKGPDHRWWRQHAPAIVSMCRRILRKAARPTG